MALLEVNVDGLDVLASDVLASRCGEAKEVELATARTAFAVQENRSAVELAAVAEAVERNGRARQLRRRNTRPLATGWR